MHHYNVIVAGGSVSGLIAAREIASGGGSVVVFEEDSEIGTPEHCGGLVSIGGIQNLGIVPDAAAIENDRIKRARILSPSNGFEIGAENQKVIVLDRRAFDKQIALQTQRAGADIRVKCSVKSWQRQDSGYAVKTSDGEFTCEYLVDARGVASMITRKREGVLQSAQYEVYAEWIERDTIQVVFDSKMYPGFFAWVIPTGEGVGKVGVAGRGINAASALGAFIESKGARHSVVRKVYAPIWVNGHDEKFVNDRLVIVGDAAGQSKPTTAGGIYTCGMAGLIAGRALANSISEKNDSVLDRYEKKWLSLFESEFEKMLLARRLLERLDNAAIDQLFAAIPREKIEEASATGDFDFHSAAIGKILGAKIAAKIAKAILGNELRRLADF